MINRVTLRWVVLVVGAAVLAACGSWFYRYLGRDDSRLTLRFDSSSTPFWPAPCVAFSPDGRFVAAGGYTTGGILGCAERPDISCIKIWDAATGVERSAIVKDLLRMQIEAIVFTPDWKTLAVSRSAPFATVTLYWKTSVSTGGSAGTIRLNAQEEKCLGYLEGDLLALSPDGNLLAVRTDGLIRIWDVTSKKEQVRLAGSMGARSVVFAPDGRTLASGHDDGAVRTWGPVTGEPRTSCLGHENGVLSVAFSPDGKTLATSGSDKTVRLWDIGTGKKLSCYSFRGNGIGHVAFSPDGHTLAVVSGPGLQVIDPKTGRVLASLRGHRSVLALAFSPDGTQLATVSLDGTVKLWNAPQAKTPGE
jgi:WD40 repeat protein